MKHAAIGLRARSGWATLVAIAGSADSPSVIDRRRIELVKTFTYEFRQPYHTAVKMGLKKSAEFISRSHAEAKLLARNALQAAQNDLRGKGFSVAGCGLLLASGRPLPDLAGILASHALIHTADGELFRHALADASEHCGLPITKVKERELYEHAAKVLRRKADVLKRRIADLGRPLGPPWSQDEKLSALIAWLVLAARPTSRRPPDPADL
jgi:hypothetical protein